MEMTTPVEATPGRRGWTPEEAGAHRGRPYVLTSVSIPTLALYQPVQDPSYVAGAGPDTPVIVGGFLEIIVALAGIGTAVAMHPAVKRQDESLALGLVGSRTPEAAVMFAGVASLWTIVGLRQASVGKEGALMGQTLVAFYDRRSSSARR